MNRNIRMSMCAALAMIAAAMLLPVQETQAATCSTSSSSFYKSKSKYDSFGNYDTFWSNYYLYGRLYGWDKSSAGTPADKLEVKAGAYSDARVFGIRKRIAEVKANAYSIYGDSVGGNIDAYVLGSNIYHRSWSYPLYYGRSWSRTFFSASQWFMVGIVPMHVTEEVTGSLGFDVSGGPETNGVSATFEPWVRSDLSTSVGVDIIVAGFGFEGTVKLIRIGAPVLGEMALGGDCLDWNLRVDLDLSTIDGFIELWAKVILTYRLKIFEWSGYSTAYNLLNQSGAINLK